MKLQQKKGPPSACPYPSNCSSRKTLFSHVYTVVSCEEECLFKEVYQTCGDVPDIWRKHLESPVKSYQGEEYLNQTACIWHMINMYLNGEFSLRCQCLTACKVVSYKAEVKRVGESKHNEWGFFISYAPSRKETHIKQVPDYTLEEFLGAFGGILGLCVGASLLSVIEILLYITLHIVKQSVKRIRGVEQIVICT